MRCVSVHPVLCTRAVRKRRLVGAPLSSSAQTLRRSIISGRREVSAVRDPVGTRLGEKGERTGFPVAAMPADRANRMQVAGLRPTNHLFG